MTKIIGQNNPLVFIVLPNNILCTDRVGHLCYFYRYVDKKKKLPLLNIPLSTSIRIMADTAAS